MLDCQTRNSEGVFEKKNNFRRGGGFMEIRRHRGVEHFGISEGRGGKISMPPVVWYGYFLESPIVGDNDNGHHGYDINDDESNST